MKTHKDVV